MINRKPKTLEAVKRERERESISLRNVEFVYFIIYKRLKKQSNLIRFGINELKIEVKNKGHPT